MDARQQTRAALEFARGFSKGLIDETPADKWLQAPGAAANHVLWNVGHLGVSHHWVRSQIDATVTPRDEKWRKLFGGGSTPTNDAAVYPKIADVRSYYEAQWDAVLAQLDAISDAELAAPVSEDAAYLAKNKLGLFSFIAWHEGLHAGQIAMARKAAGLKPKFA